MFIYSCFCLDFIITSELKITALNAGAFLILIQLVRNCVFLDNLVEIRNQCRNQCSLGEILLFGSTRG